MKLSELDESKKDLFFERIDLAQIVQETKARLQLQAQKAQVWILTEREPLLW